MRISVRKQPNDICRTDGLRALLSLNPELILLVTNNECGSKCESIRTAADRISDRKQVPVAEVEFSKSKSEECPAIERELRADVGSFIIFKQGREVARGKGTGFPEHDERKMEEALS